MDFNLVRQEAVPLEVLMQGRGPLPHFWDTRRLVLMQGRDPLPHLRRSRSRCQRSQMVTRNRENCRGRCEALSILAQEFEEGFALVTVMVGRQRVNVMMIRRSFVLVEIKGVVLGNWNSLYPLAAGLTISCRAGLREWKSLWPLAVDLTTSRRAALPRTMPADASYPNGSPQEH